MRVILGASRALTCLIRPLTQVPLVKSVHDIHVWHLSQSLSTLLSSRPGPRFLILVSNDYFSVILASLHVCVPEGTTLEQWEKTEQYLQHCFSAYGISHVTISPEIQRDTQSSGEVSEEGVGRGCRLPSDEYGCSVSDLKKRRATGV